jgi:hypothetical protein
VSTVPEPSTRFDATDAGPTPTPFVAVTVNVYTVPGTKPLTLIELQGATQFPVKPPGIEIAL